MTLSLSVSAQTMSNDITVHGIEKSNQKILSLIQDNSNLKEQGETDCKESSSEKEPFYVSDAYKQGSKIYENFRELDDPTKSERYIPKGSIVFTPPELMELETSSNYRVPIEVMAVPEDKLEKTLRGSKHYSFRNKAAVLKGKNRVKPKDKGYIDKRSLKQVDQYVFMLKNDAKVYKTHKGEVLNDKKIQLKIAEDGNYATRLCCLLLTVPVSTKPELYCQEFHIYEFLDKDNNVIGEDLFRNLSCNIFQDFYPVPKKNSDEVYNILNLLKGYANTDSSLDYFNQSVEIIPKTTNTDVNPEAALIKIPLDENQKGPYNSYHYRPDDKENSDAFLEPTAQCAFMQVLKEFNKDCKEEGCQVQFGDMHHEDNWGPHSTHDNGQCIDIRFFRKTTNVDAGLTYKNKEYDREKTEKFTDLLMKAGAQNIYLNDYTLRKKYYTQEKLEELYGNDYKAKKEKVYMPVSMDKHNDHMHFCFKKSNPRVVSTCKSGFKSP